MNSLLQHHIENLRRSGLNDDTIKKLGFYSGSAKGSASDPKSPPPRRVYKGNRMESGDAP